jgi:hypothetical protein
MTRASTLTVAGWVLALLGPLPGLAQDEGAFDRTPQDCISASSIDETDVIDDQNIVFRMRGNRVYRNHLPRKCPGLERENRFAYEIRGSRLCSIDTITVLEQFGVGLQRGFTCRLGEFVPLSPAEVEDLEFREDGGPSQSEFETESVELPREDSAADDTAPAPTDSGGERGAPEPEQPD